jgi:Xaa-Pro aminopeptidase
MIDVDDRLARARRAMSDADMSALCLSVGSDLPYLTGYRAMDTERLTMFVLRTDGRATMVVPELEAPRVDTSSGSFEIRPWAELEDPVRIVDDLLRGVDRVAIGDQTWSRFALALQDCDAARRWVPAGELMAGLRIVKSDAEIDALRGAAATVDGVVDDLVGIRWSGRSEIDLSRELKDRTLGGGHQTAEFAIVASGPNGASPHHEPGRRIVEPGDAIVLDFGGHQDGYASDTTRMFVVGTPPDGFDEAFAVLRSAQEAATAAVRPGVTAGAIDATARSIIADAGYGEYFIHRTGHGIGMDVHEHPYIVSGSQQELEPGMAFSIEPGIYKPGEWGMRIEDIVAVTDDGVESLNRSDRAYRIVT